MLLFRGPRTTRTSDTTQLTRHEARGGGINEFSAAISSFLVALLAPTLLSTAAFAAKLFTRNYHNAGSLFSFSGPRSLA